MMDLMLDVEDVSCPDDMKMTDRLRSSDSG